MTGNRNKPTTKHHSYQFRRFSQIASLLFPTPIAIALHYVTFESAVPELPEVETVRTGLATLLEGRTISRVNVHREGLRFPFPKNLSTLLGGRTIERIGRRAKYLLFHLDNGSVVLSHLGMSGKFTLFNSEIEFENAGGLSKHDHLVLRTVEGCMAVYNDPRRFGIIDFIAADESGGEGLQDGVYPHHKLLDELGPEPLSDQFDAAALCDSLRGKSTAIKTALLDQRIVAGLGNIYVCEILFRAAISPRRKSSTVAGVRGITKRSEKIVLHTKEVLAEAIEAGGSTISDFAAVDGELGYFAHSFQVYGREGEPCLRLGCGGEIGRITQSGRSTFYCGRCQR